MSVQIS